VHLVGDLLQSIGVIIASIVIIFRPDFKIVDPICTFIFSVIVLFTTGPVFKECIQILMESSPKDVRTD
jgi:divalent metal cation (Fe/Co/Zn/Cd) transporter